MSVFIEPEAVRVFCKAAKVRPMTPVAHEVLYRAGKFFGALARHRQIMVDLLAQPAERRWQFGQKVVWLAFD